MLWLAIPLWTFLSYRAAERRSFFSLRETPSLGPAVSLIRVLVAFASFIAVQFGVSLLFFSSFVGLPHLAIWTTCVASLLSFSCLTFLCSRPSTQPLWGWSSSFSFLKDGRFAFGTYLIVFPWVFLLSQTLTLTVRDLLDLPANDQLAVQLVKDAQQIPSLFTLLATLIVTVIPISEEILFRGFLQTYFKGFLPRWGAIILASLFFTFFHFSAEQGFANIEILPPLFLFSLALGFAYEKRQSLAASIFLHALFNLLSILFLMEPEM